ncbi:FAD/NAD(P)-binding domain-containing protein [Sistotremastrum niveocremeum HHB9708]|uniref:FAD/NAD(P)-binding domain-containing protein n=1 Tax=Sistotremastrum niveocremeum HHB9708 TaxID=1314777 RepID=A0A164RJI4_9AGAM|nr:FAD/NAD(P)-binding domain-containing protein [Sistotremastrum niveocremeum HHB9708]
MNSSPIGTPLNVIIVGAGLVGLATALALRRAGHHVEIYEKSSFSREVGAAVTCGPNATRILEGLGCDFGRMRAVEHTQTRYFGKDQADGDLSFVSRGSDLFEKFGAKFYLVHRVDLHTELKDRATSSVGIGESCILHLGSAVLSLDAESGTIGLGDGSYISGDIVIVADGINSSLRKFITPHTTPHPSGLAAFRTTIFFSLVNAENEPGLEWVRESKRALCLINDDDGRRNLTVYPCRGGEVLNVAGLHPRTPGAGGLEEEKGFGGHVSSPEDFLEAFKDFSARYKELIRLCPVDNVTLWPLLLFEELPTWIKGRACLVGDAAHAMFPMLGQGAAQGFEDAITLATLLPSTLSTSLSDAGKDQSDTINTRLRLFESLRKSRATEIQTLSNRIGRGLPVLKFEAEVEEMLYGYDAAGITRDALGGI